MDEQNRQPAPDREKVAQTISFKRHRAPSPEAAPETQKAPPPPTAPQAAPEAADNPTTGAQPKVAPAEAVKAPPAPAPRHGLGDPDRTLNVLVIPAVLLLCTVFLTVCAVANLFDPSFGGVVGSAVSSALYGVYGYTAFGFLFFLALAGIRWRQDLAHRRVLVKALSAFFLLLFVSVLLYTFLTPAEARGDFLRCYDLGRQRVGGGLFGAVLGYALNTGIDRFGTTLVCAVGILVCAVLYLEVDIRKTALRLMAAGKEKREEQRRQRQASAALRAEEREKARIARKEAAEKERAARAEARAQAAQARTAQPPAESDDFFDKEVSPVLPQGDGEKKTFRFVDIDGGVPTQSGEMQDAPPLTPTPASLLRSGTQARAHAPFRFPGVPEEEEEHLAPVRTAQTPAEETEEDDAILDILQDPTLPQYREEATPERSLPEVEVVPEAEDTAPVPRPEPVRPNPPEEAGRGGAMAFERLAGITVSEDEDDTPPAPVRTFAVERADDAPEEPEDLTEPDVPNLPEPPADPPRAPGVHITPDMVVTKTRITEADPSVLPQDAREAPVPPPPPPVEKKPYQFPPLSLLKSAPVSAEENIDGEINESAQKLVDVLASFKVPTHIVGVSRGPRITRYELVPETGIRVRAIANLVDDITMGMAAEGIRIEAPIPGKAAVGVEIPNKKPTTVYLRDMVDTAAFRDAKTKTTVCLGSDVTGEPVYADLAKMPHLLVAGATGMGKSVCINIMITSLLYKARPDEVRLILIDPKKVEFNMYSGIPHLLVPVVTDAQKAAAALNWAVKTMEERFDIIEQAGVRDIKGYNATLKDHPERTYMEQIVIIIDELNDLMIQARDTVESSICRIAQKARAAGIHLIIGTQRPSVDVITGVIKANIPSRVAFHVSQQVDSRTILDTVGAEKLLNNGDMLFFCVGFPRPKRVQGAFISDEEVAGVVNFLKSQGGESYDSEVIAQIEREAERAAASQKKGSAADEGGDEDEDDPRFFEAVEVAIEAGKISTSYLQRKMGIGYGKAAKYIDRMQEKGFVSEPDGQRPRNVLITSTEFNEWRLKMSE